MRSTEDVESLISRVALGERAAFSELYDATSAKLLGTCLRVLKDRAAAEDAMQDAYVKVWKNADRYRVTGHSPMTWLITIARNTAIDRLRVARAADDLDDYTDRIAAPGLSPEQQAVNMSESRRIVDCMQELPDNRAAAVRGAYLEGQSYSDLATAFDIPLNTMRTWLRRSLIALRECLAR